MKYLAVADHIVQWLTDYSENSNTNGFVVGVSGGIDSALTSKLCAMTGKSTLCLEMPIHQSQAQVSRASRHVDKLIEDHSNVSRIEVDLSKTFETLRQALPGIDNDEMALVNSRARLRMTTLYYFAGAMGMLVAGTGNKVEDFGVGFYTKYGDGGVDLSPIADLNKTEVYGVAGALGISDEIMKAPPTDGLWGDDRTDADQLGATYPELEWAMFESDRGKTAEDFTGRDKEVMEIYLRLHRANRHKMEPIPVCHIPEDLR